MWGDVRRRGAAAHGPPVGKRPLASLLRPRAALVALAPLRQKRGGCDATAGTGADDGKWANPMPTAGRSSGEATL